MISKIKLGVNIDHVATIRNARGNIHPEPIKAALIAQSAGADNITAHLREDRRHISDIDIKNLTKEQAKEIYKRDYWDKNRVDELPEQLRHIFFDMCVNQGRGRAIKILQRSANAKGADLVVDGGLGPKTIGALKGEELDRVRAYRIKYYADLVTRKPDLEKFYFGWFRRALEV